MRYKFKIKIKHVVARKMKLEEKHVDDHNK